MLKEVYLNTNRETTILLYILRGGGKEYGDRQALVAGDAGLSSWLVVLGPRRRSWLVVLGPRHRWWVVLGPRRQLRVVLLALVVFRGWRGWALVALFVGSGGVPLSRRL